MKFLKRLLLGLLVAAGLLVGLTFLPAFSHFRHYVAWGPHTVFDFRTHPYRTIAPSPRPQPWPLDAAYNKKTIPDTLLKEIEANRTLAFLVFQDGKLVHEQYWHHGRDSISGSFSAAKSIISLLIGRAIDEGKIKSVNQPVADFLPSFREGGKEKITLRNLLTMSSGLNWNEGDKGYMSFNARAYYGDDEANVVDALGVKEPAGKTWDYRSGDTQVLGLVLEKIYGRTISALAAEKLLHPLGMEHEAKWLLDGGQHHEKAFCCFNAIARDYARLGQLVLQKGNWNGQQLVSSHYVAEATTPAADLKDPTEGNKSVDYYGYQFWIFRHRGLVIPQMNGLFGQYVYIIPDKNAVIVRLGESTITRYEHHFQPENRAYVDAALAVLR